jgi:hypothetical protein
LDALGSITLFVPLGLCGRGLRALFFICDRITGNAVVTTGPGTKID